MRKDPESPRPAALDRLKAPWDRARRWLNRRGPATRAGLALAGLVGVGTLGYLAAGDSAPGAGVALFEGRRLSSDDLTAIRDALDAEAVPYRPDVAGGRIVVAADRKAAALEAVARRKATPATLDDLARDVESEASFFLTPADREKRERALLEQALKRQIEGLDPSIASAHVRIYRERARGLSGPRWDVHAYVYLKVEGGRQLSLNNVEGIETFLIGSVPDLKAEGITVADQAGRKYLAAGDIPRKEEGRKHLQVEEWQAKIAEGLAHIPGVGVSVALDSVPVPQPAPEPPPAAPAAEVAVANGSMEVAPAPKLAAVPPPPTLLKDQANVWVRVPLSFYLMAAQARTPNRKPSAELLKQMEETTERLAREAVDISIPKHLQGAVKVVTVQDDLTASRMTLLPPEPEPDRLRPMLAVAGAGGLVVVASGAAAALRIASRRPPARAGAAWRPGFLADEPVAGPAERVRELIRLNPGAAAGVLQRWIGQGGAVG